MKKKQNNQKEDWHLIDLKNKILGRSAVRIATLLQGKHKPTYVPYLESGDMIVVVNASKVKVSGKKEESKKYLNYSGYPGGLKERKFKDLKITQPQVLIKRAVLGMLPKNKLSRKLIKNLYVFSGEEHPFTDKELKAIKEN